MVRASGGLKIELAMTNDKQINFWRKEFECNMASQGCNLYMHPEGDYLRDEVEYMWQGFLMAKRSMPPIELPKKCESLVFQSTFNCAEVERAITAAGYQYKVKE